MTVEETSSGRGPTSRHRATPSWGHVGRVRRTLILFTVATFAMAIVDVTPFNVLTTATALVGVYAVRCAR